MKKENEFYEAWRYLEDHDMFDGIGVKFINCLDISVQLVNPTTNSISSDDRLNTKTEVWLECGEALLDDKGYMIGNTHDIDLDCGGDTFEEAIIELARLVKKKYRG